MKGAVVNKTKSTFSSSPLTDNNMFVFDPEVGGVTSVFTRTVNGLVPAPNGSGAIKYLREDGTWVTPPDTDTVYDDTVIQSEVGLNTADRHSHLNKPTLNKFGEDANGLPTYNGVNVDTTIAQRDVYDGLDSTDNTISLAANNGKFLRDVQITQQTAIDLNTAKETNINHPLVEKAVPANALFTDTTYDENISVRRVFISTSDLPVDFTAIDVKNWLNANESIGDSEILFWETTEDTVVVTLTINILTPTEGQEITGDVNITFELFNETSINIITPTEGQEITGDVNITFEII